MTTREFVKAAGKRAIVQWHPSGKIEQLHYCNEKVYATNLVTGDRHPIYQWKRRRKYHCKVINPGYPVKLGDLL